MKNAILVLALLIAAGLLGLRTDGADAPKAAPAVEAAPVRFAPNPVPLFGTPVTVAAVSPTADGKRAALAGGSVNPPAGFVAVLEIASKKELFSLRLSQSATSVAFSPDGKHVAYADQGGKAELLDAASGKPVFTLRLDGSARVAFAPDGKSIATVTDTDTKTVQIWDVPGGTEQAKLKGAVVPLVGVTFSPDGKRLAAIGSDGDQRLRGFAYIWDILTGRLIATCQPGPNPQAVAFSRNNAELAVSCNGQVTLWEAANGKQKLTINTPGQVFALEYSSGDQMLLGAMSGVVGGQAFRGVVQVWNPMTGEETAQFSHPGCRGAAFMEDGKRVISGGLNRSVQVWDVPGKKLLATLAEDLRPQELPVPLAVAAAPDGSLVALATEERLVQLRDGRTGAVKHTLRGHDDAVTCLAFSPDGQAVLTGSADKTARLWDAATGKELVTFKGHTNWVYAVAFDPEGKTVATGAYDKTVRLWDRQTGKELGSIDAHRGSVRAIAFAPDGKRLASAGSDRTVKVWDVTTHALLVTLKGHEGAVRAVAFSPDGKALASASEDGTVRIWESTTGKQLHVCKGHVEDVLCVTFAGSRTVVSGGADGTVRLWDTVSGEPVSVLQGHTGGVTGFTMLSGGGLISAGQDRTLKRWRRDAPGPVRMFTGHTGVVQTGYFSPDGKRAVSCGMWPEGDQTIRVWDTQTGREVLKIDAPSQVPAAIFSPNGKFILAGGGDHIARLWDVETGNEVKRFEGHTETVNGLAFSADGKQILTSGDKTARLWDVEGGNEVKRFAGHTDIIRRVAFDPDGKHVFTASRDSTVRRWLIETGKPVKQYKSNGKWADCLAISKDGKFLATGGKDVQVFEVESGKQLVECAGHIHGLNHVTFSADAKYVLSASYDGTARLWDRATGKELYRFRGQRDFTWSAEFSPDDKWVLTTCGGNSVNGQFVKGSDFTVRLWQIPDARTMAEFPPEN